MSEDTVRVAVRIRPLVRTEIEKGCQTCLTVIPGESQIQVRGTEKAFTFNYVFAPEVEQDSFYKTAIQDMVKNVFQGYNVTILAYGQTGSGKTHSMGTNYAHGEQPGVIPRAVQDIFAIINLKQDWIFNVTVSFMELYQEQLYDLLSKKQRNQCIVDIREDSKGVKVAGLTEVNVTNAEETLQCLTQGSLGRATGATAMNACSSRSHAIFTITIYQQKRDDPNTATTAKFHLVDLAGSERSKKTQATGERFKEGVNINKGLLALGNVISQLGEGGSHSYIGYRDSKLTRLLQDSLGGNSMTLMIACVSPADYNLDETISTLRYADRARRIKNKPIVNQDPGIAEINRLHKTIQELRVALLDTGHGGSCPPEHSELQEKNRLLQKRVRDLASKLNENLLEVVHMHEQAELAEQARERNKAQLTAVLHEFEDLSSLNVCAICTDLCNKIETIRMKLLDLQKDDAKNAEELRCHDICGSAGSSSSGIVEEKPHTSGSEDEFDKSTDLDEKQEEHTLQQAERNNEVQNINRELALKEDLISKLLKNSSHLADYTKELQEMEQEIKSLQAEKEELLQALQSVKANNASSKIAETRRKKVQELEKKITELTRKCVEQNKAIKMKEKSDQQIKNLTTEIQSLKQIRVKLVRQMRSEAERFGKWRQERERELSKLKDQDRKRQNQMARLESLYNKQQNVMKRKIEEATSINKRLKEALEMQKKAHQRREKTSGSKENAHAWVTQELKILLSTVDAKCTLERLMQDRAVQTNELQTLKSSDLDDSPATKQKIAELEQFIDLRNAQIADFQQKILEADQENRARTRWHAVQSLDLKEALNILFDFSAEDRKKRDAEKHRYDLLMDKCDKLQMKIREYELREKESRTKYRQELFCELQEQASRKQSDDEINDTDHKPRKQKSVTVKKWKSKLNDVDSKPLYDVSNVTDDSIVDDDVTKDPDWKKTPLYSRIRTLWSTTTKSDDERVAAKRSSDGDIKCGCKTKCTTRLCTCRKHRKACSNCNCNPETCQNVDKENTMLSLFTDFSADPTPVKATKRSRKARKPDEEKQTFLDVTTTLESI